MLPTMLTLFMMYTIWPMLTDLRWSGLDVSSWSDNPHSRLRCCHCGVELMIFVLPGSLARLTGQPRGEEGANVGRLVDIQVSG